jgi:formylglycine-generating enzyme required for sulfatase activity
MLKTVELAFLEALLLSVKAPPSILIYLLKRKNIEPNASLLKLATHCQLISQNDGEKIMRNAEQAVAAAGSNAFSFSKGALIGPWEIDDSRGIGLGGSHFIANHESRDQKALLRLIEPGLNDDTERLQRLDDRANSGAEPPHPSILKIDETGEDFGWLYTVTYNTDGWNLSSRLAQGPLLEAEAIPLMRTIVDALKVAHGFQVVHGGLSPLSMLMNQDASIFLSDFGVGSVHLDGPLTGQRPGVRLGTMLYTAPELLWGKASEGIDPRSDIYSLGTVIYDCILRADAQPNPDPNVPWAIDPPTSPAFRTILAQCMNASASARYPSLEYLAADLDRLRTGQPPLRLPPPQPNPSFLAPRAPTAVPQITITKKILDSSESSEESDEEIRRRDEAGNDFLAAIAASAPPPEVPEGYQDELFNQSPVPTVVKPKPKPTKTKDSPKKPSAKHKKTQSGENEKSTAKKSTGRLPKRDKNEKISSRESRKSGRSAAPAKRTGPRATNPKGSASNLSILILFILVGSIGGGAFGARKISEIPPDNQAKRLQIRAQYLIEKPETKQFSKAIEDINLAILTLKNSHTPIKDLTLKISRLRLQRFLTRHQAIKQYRLESPTLLANKGPDKKQKIDEALQRYKNTPAKTLLELDNTLANNGSYSDLAEIGKTLFLQGLPKDAQRALERSFKLKPNLVIKKWLKLASTAANDMAFVPNSSVEGPNNSSITIDAFYIDKHETTRQQYNQFLKDLKAKAKEGKSVNPSEHTPPKWNYSKSNAKLPITNVTFINAQAFLKWARKNIPTTEQFTIATRGPGKEPFPWGQKEPTLFRACLAPYFNDLTPINSFPAGATLTHINDLIGNAAEWCDQPGDDKLARGSSYLNKFTDQATLLSGSTHPVDERKPHIGFRGTIPAKLPQN